MVKRKVLMHCDADLETGMGHLMRCLCLAEEARGRGWEVLVAGRFGNRALEHAHALAPEQGLLSLTDVSAVRELQRMIEAESPNVVHLDSYNPQLDGLTFPAELVSNMQDGDFGRRVADLHIDANLDAELSFQPYFADERTILGVAGMQIRAAMRELDHTPRRAGLRVPRVLIVLGGTDPQDLTPHLVRRFASHEGLHLTVICRPEVEGDVIGRLSEVQRRRVKVQHFTPDLPSLANSMDLVVTAAGTSVWDFAAAGIPMAIVAVTENQIKGYRAAEAHGLGFMLGEPPHTDIEHRIDQLAQILSDPQELEHYAEVGTNLVDGWGAWRVVSAWEELLDSVDREDSNELSPLSIRFAQPSDAQRLFGWRNDPGTRQASRSNQVVAWADHCAWFERALADPDRMLLVVENGEDAVATVRWDKQADRTWVSSITIAPEWRGRGLASSVLSAGESVFADKLPVELRAEIHRSNTASQRLFSRSGYLPFLPNDQHGFETRAKWLPLAPTD